MSRADQPGRENAELRDRLARLSAAILRISASLEPDAVLREVVDSARALTGAGCGVIATVDESRAAPGFRQFRPESPGAPGAGRVARRAASVRTPENPSGSVEAVGPERLRPLPGLFLQTAAAENLSGYPDAASGRWTSATSSSAARRGGRGFHGGRRRDPAAVRLAGGHRDSPTPAHTATSSGGRLRFPREYSHAHTKITLFLTP